MEIIEISTSKPEKIINVDPMELRKAFAEFHHKSKHLPHPEDGILSRREGVNILSNFSYYVQLDNGNWTKIVFKETFPEDFFEKD